MTNFSNLLSISPKGNLPHRATVIFLHGLGDGGEGWFSSFQQFADRLGGVKFLFPIAPVQPVTLNMGYKMPSWYDIYSLDDRSSKEDSEGMMKTKSLIESLIEKELSSSNLPAERIILGGFSQGGAMSLMTGLTTSHRLGGVISLSGYLPLKDFVGQETNDLKRACLPVLMCHGTSDSVVAFKWGKLSMDHLKEKIGMKNIQFNTYEGLDHGASATEMNDVIFFIESLLNQ